MVQFDWKNFRFTAKENYKGEVKTSKSIQDEVKIYNERFPRSLSALYQIKEQLDEATASFHVGDFSAGEMSGDTYEEQVWSYFLSKGFNKKCIAGILGNMQHESGVEPTTLQNGVGPGTGLVQWEDGHSGRWNLLDAWAQKNGRDKWDLSTQLDYLWLEMCDSYHGSLFVAYGRQYGYDLSGGGETTAKKFGTLVQDIDHAVYIFELTIERAGSKQYALRSQYAHSFYEKYKDWEPTQSSGKFTGKFVEPYKQPYTATSEYGMRNLGDGSGVVMHDGIDLSAGHGTPLYAVAAGVVAENSFQSGGLGNYVLIDHGVMNGKQMYSRYGHMSAPSPLRVGQRVTIDTQVGLEGESGYAYGAHLHLEIHEAPAGQNIQFRVTSFNPRNYITFTERGRS